MSTYRLMTIDLFFLLGRIWVVMLYYVSAQLFIWHPAKSTYVAKRYIRRILSLLVRKKLLSKNFRHSSTVIIPSKSIQKPSKYFLLKIYREAFCGGDLFQMIFRSHVNMANAKCEERISTFSDYHWN